MCQWIGSALVQIMACHYLNQCWIIANWAIGNTLQWNFNHNQYIFKKMHLKMSSVKWRPFCPGGDELTKRVPGHHCLMELLAGGFEIAMKPLLGCLEWLRHWILLCLSTIWMPSNRYEFAYEAKTHLEKPPVITQITIPCGRTPTGKASLYWGLTTSSTLCWW